MQAFKGISCEMPCGSSYGCGKRGLARSFVDLKSMENQDNDLDDIVHFRKMLAKKLGQWRGS
jgi:hypothetical protein